MSTRRAAGFTLVELIAVMVLSAILALVVWRNISAPIRSFVDLQRRAELVDAGDTALSRMNRELKLALPNSVRVAADGTAIEFLRTVTGGRYRAQAAPSGGGPILDFTTSSGSFQVLGGLPNGETVRSGGGGRAACLAGSVDCVVVFNTGQPADCTGGAVGSRTNAWCGDNVAGLSSIDLATGTLGFDRADAGTPLPFPSAEQRFHVVDTPVSYVCDGGVLTRHANYPIPAAMSVPPAGGTSARLAGHLESCEFTYVAGTATRAALVTIRLRLSDQTPEGETETVTLFGQTHVPNVP
ncbi:MAG: type II secretion system protein [Gammaproteobacteria bacterium]|nr:type II secretion system protein [Gammaproteobacteria bacterium]